LGREEMNGLMASVDMFSDVRDLTELGFCTDPWIQDQLKRSAVATDGGRQHADAMGKLMVSMLGRRIPFPDALVILLPIPLRHSFGGRGL